MRRWSRASSSFNPSVLFQPSDVGDWWNVSISSSVWQTSAGSTPAGNGDLLGRIDGLKNGHSLTCPNGNRATLTFGSNYWYALFNGTSTYIASSFTLNQPVTRISAVQQVTWGSANHLFDGVSVNTGALFQFNATPTLAVYAGGVQVTTNDLAVGVNGVVTEIFNGASSKIAVNNGSYTTGNAGAGNPGGLTIGTGGGPTTQWSNMQFFGCIVIGRILSDLEIAHCRTYFGKLAGVSL